MDAAVVVDALDEVGDDVVEVVDGFVDDVGEDDVVVVIVLLIPVVVVVEAPVVVVVDVVVVDTCAFASFVNNTNVANSHAASATLMFVVDTDRFSFFQCHTVTRRRQNIECICLVSNND
jgi:hypothetical protein